MNVLYNYFSNLSSGFVTLFFVIKNIPADVTQRGCLISDFSGHAGIFSAAVPVSKDCMGLCFFGEEVALYALLADLVENSLVGSNLAALNPVGCFSAVAAFSCICTAVCQRDLAAPDKNLSGSGADQSALRNVDVSAFIIIAVGSGIARSIVFSRTGICRYGAECSCCEAAGENDACEFLQFHSR